MWTKKFVVLGHRGARGLAPENTLSAFKLALEMELDGVEMDVFRCGSGEVVVFHDDRLDNLTGKNGFIERASWAELKELDVGSHFHPRYANEKIPKLAEVLDLIGDKIIINIELKGENAKEDGLEKAVLDLLDERGLKENIIISSFNPVRIARVKKLKPTMKVGLLLQPDWAGWLRRAWFMPMRKADLVHAEVKMVSPSFVRRAKRRGQKVLAWSPNTEEEISRMVECGVDGVITDRPDIALKVLNRDGDYKSRAC